MDGPKGNTLCSSFLWILIKDSQFCHYVIQSLLQWNELFPAQMCFSRWRCSTQSPWLLGGLIEGVCVLSSSQPKSRDGLEGKGQSLDFITWCWQERNVAATDAVEMQRKCGQVFLGGEVFIEISGCWEGKLCFLIQATNFHGCLWEFCF